MSDSTMAQLIVGNLAPGLVRRLRARAARHGRSAEAEHREILQRALPGSDEQTLGDILLAMPDVGADRDFARRSDRPRQLRP